MLRHRSSGNGLLSFWVALTVFGTWYLVMFVVLRGAVEQEFSASDGIEAEPEPVPRAAVPQHA